MKDPVHLIPCHPFPCNWISGGSDTGVLHHSLSLDSTSLRVWSKRRDVHARLTVAVSLAFVWSSENVQMS